MLRKLFLASASVLMLAIAYRVAVPPAHAQSAATVDAAMTDPESGGLRGFAAVVGRTFYADGVPYGPPLPGTSKAIAIGWCDNCGGGLDFVVTLDNGDMWHIPLGGSAWQYYGSAIGASGPTPAHATSFGALKVKYR